MQGLVHREAAARAINDKVRAELVAQHPVGRHGQSDEVEAFLSSAAALFVTGAYYPVDGCYLAR